MTPRKGSAPTDTLTAAQAIARYPWYQPERPFRLLDDFYPLPAGTRLRHSTVSDQIAEFADRNANAGRGFWLGKSEDDRQRWQDVT